MGALKGMFSFFTMLRLDITQDDMDAMDRNMWLTPLVGALYGLIAAVMMTSLTHYIGNPLMSSVITFFVIFAFNRFLHIDGTIDVGDGLVVAGTREDHLRALKDSRIGAGGMAFALMIILMSITMAASIWPFALMALLLFAGEVLAKVGMVTAAAAGTPGDGMAGNSVRNTTAKSVILAVVLAATLIALFAGLVYLLQEHTGVPVALADHYIVLLVAATIVSVFVGIHINSIQQLSSFTLLVHNSTQHLPSCTVLATNS